MKDDPGIDPSALARLNRIGGPAFVGKMIDLFLQEAPGRLTAARKAEEMREIAAIGEAAHALKSSAQNFGAVNLGQIAQKIEMLARDNRPGDIPALLDDLEKAFAEARAWLESQRDTFKT